MERVDVERPHSRPRSCSVHRQVRDSSRRIRAGTGKDPCRSQRDWLGAENGSELLAAVGAEGI